MRRRLGGRLRSGAARVLLVCAVLLVCLVAGSLVLVFLGGGGGSARAKGTLSARATLSSRTILFGDTVVARLDLILPRGTGRGEPRVAPVFSPFRIVSRHVERQDLGGGLERVTLRYGLTCLTSHCLGSRRVMDVQFQPVSVSIPGRRVRAVWPPLVQVSRVRDVSAPVADNLDTGPAVSPRLGSSAATYEALGVAAFSLVVVLSAWLYLRRRARLRLEAPLRLSASLQALLERIEDGLPEDVLYRQRHALDALAVELRHRRVDGSLAVEAERLAWAPEQPDPDEIRSLCARVRRTVKA